MPELVVKSERSTTPALVRFINKSTRTVDVIWLDLHGDYAPYKTLKHNQFVDINTYTNHHWVFIDSKTRDFMRINHQILYHATPAFCPRTGKLGRTCAVIHLPLYSLRMKALLTVRNHLQDSEDINSLDLPAELKNDLQKSFEYQNKNRYSVFVPDSIVMNE